MRDLKLNGKSYTVEDISTVCPFRIGDSDILVKLDGDEWRAAMVLGVTVGINSRSYEVGVFTKNHTWLTQKHFSNVPYYSATVLEADLKPDPDKFIQPLVNLDAQLWAEDYKSYKNCRIVSIEDEDNVAPNEDGKKLSIVVLNDWSRLVAVERKFLRPIMP